MDISKILNPAPSNSEDSSSRQPLTLQLTQKKLTKCAEQQRKKPNQPTPTSTEAASQKDCEAEQTRKRGMPKEGLNTFRVKSQ
jgi:hypothetical protein